MTMGCHIPERSHQVGAQFALYLEVPLIGATDRFVVRVVVEALSVVCAGSGRIGTYGRFDPDSGKDNHRGYAVCLSLTLPFEPKA